jgi:RimJ/RimL family protein N-acetyltransferase
MSSESTSSLGIAPASSEWTLGAIALKNSQTLTVVRPGPEFAAEIVAYVNRAGGESDNLTFGANGFNVSVEDEAELLKKTRESGTSLMVAGLLDGKVVSVGNLSRSPRERIKHVATLGISVSKDQWGNGVCRAMLECMVAWAKSSGVQKIDLRVKAENTRAIAIYERFGFKREGIHRAEVLIDDVFYDEISMGLMLNETQRGGS